MATRREPPRGTRTQYGTCSSCLKQRALNADGTLVGHKVLSEETNVEGKQKVMPCAGSHRPALARKVG